MESLENLKVGDDVLVYDKNGLFEAIFYVERMTNNYLGHRRSQIQQNAWLDVL